MSPSDNLFFAQAQSAVDQITDQADNQHAGEYFIRSLDVPGRHDHIPEPVTGPDTGEFRSHQGHPPDPHADAQAHKNGRDGTRHQYLEEDILPFGVQRLSHLKIDGVDGQNP